jgi:hypothetical protein
VDGGAGLLSSADEALLSGDPAAEEAAAEERVDGEERVDVILLAAQDSGMPRKAPAKLQQMTLTNKKRKTGQHAAVVFRNPTATPALVGRTDALAVLMAQGSPIRRPASSARSSTRTILPGETRMLLKYRLLVPLIRLLVAAPSRIATARLLVVARG